MFKEVDRRKAFMAALDGRQTIILSKRDNGDFMTTDLTRKVKQLADLDGARFMVDLDDSIVDPDQALEAKLNSKVKGDAESSGIKEQGSPIRKRIKITDEVGSRIMTMHDCGWTNSAIADSVGASPATIGNYIKKWGGAKEEP